MVDVKSEVQNNRSSDQTHPNVDRNIFESAYGSQPSKANGQNEDAKIAIKSPEVRPQIDSAWPPPLELATDKPIDPSLPRELQNEAKLMKNLTGEQRRLVSTAFNALGKPLWAESEYADITGNGRYGCAASESVVKQRAGYDYADSPLVSGLVNQLQKNGWTKHSFEDRQPGDTIIKHKAGEKWKKGGGISHIGTVGADINYAYNNNSDSGTWSYKPINESFSPRNKRFVLRPPASTETLIAKDR